MKYFTKEFDQLCDTVDDRESLLKMTSEQYHKYWKEFESCAQRLPRTFINHYKSKGFHDYNLEKLELKKRTKARTFLDIILQLSDQGKYYEIHYYDVIKFETMIMEDRYCQIGDYVDGEILPVNENYMSHEFYFHSDQNHILIHFKRLSFRKLKSL